MQLSRLLLTLALSSAVACGDKSEGDSGAPATDDGADDDSPDASDGGSDGSDGSDGSEDRDGDGFAGPDDCDDDNPAVSPGADELCDGVDNDCDGDIDEDDAVDAPLWYLDGDGDGHGHPTDAVASCSAPSGRVGNSGDCDDSDDAFHPGATEDDCTDPADYNCDGSVGYADADGDGWAACEECDDTAAAVNPDATEVCDEVDNNCDGTVDEDSAADAPTWYTDADSDGYGDAAEPWVACEPPSGTVADNTDCDDTSAGVNPGAAEVCDADDVDEDCSGAADDADAGATGQSTWYADADSDGYGDPSTTTLACDLPSGHTADNTDCDDTSAGVNPGAAEVCDADDVDEDCSGAADDADASATGQSTWYADADSDGYGDPSTTTLACDLPSGHTADNTDCDDASAAVNPGATEVCDADDIDEDCSGDADDADAGAIGQSTWYADADSDGYGDPSATTLACDLPSGHTADNTDCDDTSAAVNPGAAEVCDADDIDEDCSGDADDADAGAIGQSTWYADADSDGYGDASTTTLACDLPSGHTADNTDCDDTSAGVNPGAAEVCDADDVDEDCSGDADDADAGAIGQSTWYADADSDGYGDASTTTLACEQPSGHVAVSTDCDDAEDTVYPGALEVCDGQQNDCSSTWTSDAGIASVWDLSTETWSDATATLAAGTSSSPTSLSISDEELHVCEGTWYASVSHTGDGGIVGVGDLALVVVDGGDTVRPFSSTGDNITVSNLTLSSGYNASAGGCLYLASAKDVVVEDVVISGCESSKGGGLHAYNLDSLSLTDVEISSSTATGGYGGGANIWDVTLFTMESVLIDSNLNDSGYGGGGLATYGSVVTDAYDVVISNNEVTTGYGGGWSIISGTHTADQVTVTGNTAGGAGGGIDNTGDLTLTDSSITLNEGNYGGGMRNKGGTVDADNTEISDNIANTTGAAIHMASAADTTLTDCSIEDNSHDNSGKAVLNNSGDTLILDSVDFSGNTTYDVSSSGTYLWNTTGVSATCDSTGCN